jgi:fructose-1,6-bisphosphatase/inositol monophosphatase family enzyme
MQPTLAGLLADFIQMSGAAATNLCHLAEGSIDAYYQFNLKVRSWEPS